METPKAQTDQDLVAATLRDPHAYRLLVEKYEKPLMRYIMRLGNADSDGAKDILQESFIKAYIHLNDYDLRLSFSSWIYRIVHNETINYFRTLKNRPRPVEREEDLLLFEKIADDLNLEHQSDVGRTRVVIESALDQLNQKYRDVTVLRFFEEKSYEEISDILQIPSGTVATYLSRAKLALKKALEEKGVVDV